MSTFHIIGPHNKTTTKPQNTTHDNELHDMINVKSGMKTILYIAESGNLLRFKLGFTLLYTNVASPIVFFLFFFKDNDSTKPMMTKVKLVVAEKVCVCAMTWKLLRQTTNDMHLCEYESA